MKSNLSLSTATILSFSAFCNSAAQSVLTLPELGVTSVLQSMVKDDNPINWDYQLKIEVTNMVTCYGRNDAAIRISLLDNYPPIYSGNDQYQKQVYDLIIERPDESGIFFYEPLKFHNIKFPFSIPIEHLYAGNHTYQIILTKHSIGANTHFGFDIDTLINRSIVQPIENPEHIMVWDLGIETPPVFDDIHACISFRKITGGNAPYSIKMINEPKSIPDNTLIYPDNGKRIKNAPVNTNFFIMITDENGCYSIIPGDKSNIHQTGEDAEKVLSKYLHFNNNTIYINYKSK